MLQLASEKFQLGAYSPWAAAATSSLGHIYHQAALEGSLIIITGVRDGFRLVNRVLFMTQTACKSCTNTLVSLMHTGEDPVSPAVQAFGMAS